MKVVIADTSCLIVYDKIQRLDILRKTFPELIITQQVGEEFGTLPDWLNISIIEEKDELYLELLNNLGRGEASSIALASQMKNSLLIIDEKKGRIAALKHGISIIGSLGVLVEAKRKGVIVSVREALSKIEETNFRVSESIKKKVLEKAGE
ncbi:MAG: DUF3368 domain-containing protein [Bacteroidetes bacterium]|jgi:predicted nucleic acid-binding protein|nr:DUF3368 domain-containing protein [Bacteroidota bacterium]